MILGLDEAGRGCVLGPLVVAGFLASEASESALRAAGADDSKALSPKKRDAARAALSELGTPFVREISPSEIDAGNLNELEEALLIAIVREARPTRVIVDALGHPRTIPATVARLSAATDGIPWHMAPKADSTFATVGAASIFAKTTRDAALDALRPEFGDFGSGYPSDPATRRWLTDWAKSQRPWPSFVRTRWGTIRDLAQISAFGG